MKKKTQQHHHGIMGNDNLSSVCRVSVAYPDLFGMRALKPEIQMGQIVCYKAEVPAPQPNELSVNKLTS